VTGRNFGLRVTLLTFKFLVTRFLPAASDISLFNLTPSKKSSLCGVFRTIMAHYGGLGHLKCQPTTLAYLGSHDASTAGTSASKEEDSVRDIHAVAWRPRTTPPRGDSSYLAQSPHRWTPAITSVSNREIGIKSLLSNYYMCL